MLVLICDLSSIGRTTAVLFRAIVDRRIVTKAIYFVTLVALVRLSRTESPDVTAITCEASMMGVATVTCHFLSNLNVTRKNFIVQYYKTEEANAYIVLSCNWHEDPVPECYVEDSVTFDYRVSDRVRAKVLPRVAQVGGQFDCQLVPSKGSRSQRCSLNYTTITTDQPSTTSTTSDAFESPEPCSGIGAAVNAAVLVTFFFTLLICCAMFYILLRKNGTDIKQAFLTCLRGRPAVASPSTTATSLRSDEGIVCDDTQQPALL